MSAGINLKPAEIARAFEADNVRFDHPVIMSPRQVARMLGLSIATIYQWTAEERFKGACRRGGKHMFYWRDRVIERLFNSPDWIKHDVKQKRTNQNR